MVMSMGYQSITAIKIFSFCSPMAEANKFIKTLSIGKVVPADSPSQFSLPLTFLDQFWLQTKPTSRLFFYEFSEPNIDFFDTILLKLKHSLSLTLKHYLPLAGNLTWPNDSNLPVIQYKNGDGVSLTISETQANFDYLSGDAFRESAELQSLVPNFPSSETLIPAMTMQITLFPNRGFSYAYVVHHSVMDGKSTSMFLHSWAYICKNGEVSVLPPELTPSFDRTFVAQHKELEKVYPKGIGRIDSKSKNLTTFDMTPSTTMLGTFKLTRENIVGLKDKVKYANDTSVSTFTVTTAYVGICLTKAKKVTEDETIINFSADGRIRLDPPLPPTYFGNCILFSGRGSNTNSLIAEDGFITAVNAISEALAYLKTKKILEEVERVSSVFASSVPRVFIVAGWPQFELYKVDFGWGNPVKVEMVSNNSGRVFSLCDDRNDDGGVEIEVELEKHENEAFSFQFGNGLEAL